MSFRCFYIKLIVLLFISINLNGQNWFKDTFIDPEDGYFDASDWLLEQQGFLPTPVIISEPAVGYGGGLALSYFHDKIGANKDVPPDVSVVAGATTENGSWFVGAAHLGFWDDDNIRYYGAVGGGVTKLKYYGLPAIDDRGADFDCELFMTSHMFKLRLADSKFFGGVGFTYVDSENTFQISPLQFDSKVPSLNFDIKTVSADLSLSYDSRDNIFSPSAGLAAELKAQLYSDAWGSDDSFQRYKAKALFYQPLADKFILGIRGEAQAARGDVPFLSYPYIDMRGVKMMNYQGDETILGEAELRWDVTKRWSIVGFVGMGKAFSDSIAGDSDNVYSRGVGFRYLGASKLGLLMGLDVARGPDDTTVYFQVGSAWSMR